MKLVCPECQLNSEKSQMVRILSGYTTYRGSSSFVDEDGNAHVHNNDPAVSIYRCSNGHEIVECTYAKCYATDCTHLAGVNRLTLLDGFGFI
jgi:hypothetical protein